MNGLKMTRAIIIIMLVLLSCTGCVTIQEVPFKEGLTKQDIQQAWEERIDPVKKKRPDKIIHNPRKYDADELWIYEWSGGADYYYFKNNFLIKQEVRYYPDSF